jgi:hypothetical protein
MIVFYGYVIVGWLLLLIGTYGIFEPVKTAKFVNLIEYRNREKCAERNTPRYYDIRLTQLASVICVFFGAVIIIHTLLPPQYLNGHIQL